jgi:hypothetical protein
MRPSTFAYTHWHITLSFTKDICEAGNTFVSQKQQDIAISEFI